MWTVQMKEPLWLFLMQGNSVEIQVPGHGLLVLNKHGDDLIINYLGEAEAGFGLNVPRIRKGDRGV